MPPRPRRTRAIALTAHALATGSAMNRWPRRFAFAYDDPRERHVERFRFSPDSTNSRSCRSHGRAELSEQLRRTQKRDSCLMTSANLDLVRSIHEAWERG